MRTRMLVFFLLGSFVALTACLVQFPRPAQADEVPEKYRDTVKKGLEFLVKHQHKDGHWEGADGKHPVAMTGLVGLALLMDGTAGDKYGPRPVGSKYSANVQKAVDWLIEQSRAERDGLIFSGHASETARYMEGHGLATLFLAGVARSDAKQREKLDGVLTRAVSYIVKAQSSQGGWYHTSRMEGHDFDVVLATIIQVQALQAARNAGIAVPAHVIGDAQHYLKQAIDKHETARAQNAGRSTETAAALACRFNVVSNYGGGSHDECKEWLKHCEARIPRGAALKFGGQDELSHYYYAQFLLNTSGWAEYRTEMFDRLQSSQSKEGSWPAADGIGIGPVHATALWCTVLQLDKRCHPSRLALVYAN